MTFFDKTSEGYILRVRLTPNSSLYRSGGIITNAQNEMFLKIGVISVPEKGKANKELIAFLAKKLKIAKSSIQIISGELDRWKKLAITAPSDLTGALQQLSEE